MRSLRVVIVIAALVGSGWGVPARAQSQRLDKAKQLYTEGKRAYEQNDYQKAYDAFKESYLLSHEPALLYNVSSALQGLRRPHDAAEALRSFLRLLSDDPDRAAIEERIRALEEEQRLLDAERQRNAPPAPITPPPVAPGPTPDLSPHTLSPAAAPSTSVLTTSEPSAEDRARTRRKKIVIGVLVSLAAVAVVGTAVGLAVGLSGGTEPYTAASIGPLPGTR